MSTTAISCPVVRRPMLSQTYKISLSSIIISLYHQITGCLLQRITQSLCHCITVSLYHCITTSMQHCIILPLYHSIAVSLYHCIHVSIYHRINESLYRWFAASLYHCFTCIFHLRILDSEMIFRMAFSIENSQFLTLRILNLNAICWIELKRRIIIWKISLRMYFQRVVKSKIKNNF